MKDSTLPSFALPMRMPFLKPGLTLPPSSPDFAIDVEVARAPELLPLRKELATTLLGMSGSLLCVAPRR